MNLYVGLIALVVGSLLVSYWTHLFVGVLAMMGVFICEYRRKKTFIALIDKAFLTLTFGLLPSTYIPTFMILLGLCGIGYHVISHQEKVPFLLLLLMSYGVVWGLINF